MKEKAIEAFRCFVLISGIKCTSEDSECYVKFFIELINSYEDYKQNRGKCKTDPSMAYNLCWCLRKQYPTVRFNKVDVFQLLHISIPKWCD